jgi:hypothetical protein
VTLSTHSTDLEAEMVRSILADAGIEAFILNPHAHQLYPGILGGVELQVREEELSAARQLLEEIDTDSDTS